MAIEKRLPEVPARVFTADGTSGGKITLPDTANFKVKQKVILKSNTQAEKEFEIKRVESEFILYVGPVSQPIDRRSDISAFLVSDGATIRANEQPRPSIPEQEIERHTYEEEPTVARRSMLVDRYGNPYTQDNPLPIGAVADFDVDFRAEDGDDVGHGAHPVQLRLRNPASITDGNFTEIFTYTAPVSTIRIVMIESTVSTSSAIQVKLNGTIIRMRRTSSLEKNTRFDFLEPLKLAAADVLTVEAQVERFIHAQYESFTSLEGYVI